MGNIKLVPVLQKHTTSVFFDKQQVKNCENNNNTSTKIRLENKLKKQIEYIKS